MSKDQLCDLIRRVVDGLIGRGLNRLGVLPDLDSEIAKRNKRGDRGSELTNIAKVLKRHVCRPTS